MSGGEGSSSEPPGPLSGNASDLVAVVALHSKVSLILLLVIAYIACLLLVL